MAIDFECLNFASKIAIECLSLDQLLRGEGLGVGFEVEVVDVQELMHWQHLQYLQGLHWWWWCFCLI